MRGPDRSQVAVAHLVSELNGDYEAAALLQYVCDQGITCLDAALCTLVVVDGDRQLNLVATGSERLGGRASEPLALLGPSAETARRGALSIGNDMRLDPQRWPDATNLMARLDLVGARSFPMHQVGQTIGSFTVYTDDPWGTHRDSQVGQIFADLAVLVLTQDDVLPRRTASAAAVVAALMDGQARIYQAQGLVAQGAGCSVDEAQLLLETYAARAGVSPSQAARWIVEGSLPVTALRPPE